MNNNLLKQLMIATGFALFGTTAWAETEVYGIDNAHSFANWTLRHVVAKTSGTFTDIKGKVVIDRADLSKSSVDAKINVLSVSSNHAKRDDHIKKEDYLDAGRFSEMRFVSTKVEAKSLTEGVLTGQFTMHGVTREISFPFRVLGFGQDPWGGQRIGIEAHTTLQASDYGFTWPLKPNAPVGDTIAITLLIEGVKNSSDYKPW
jgi:polyisoprenoid-binding protein YceI